MKKYLLLAMAAVVAANVVVAQEDVTPRSYKFYETGKLCPIVPYGVHGANIQNMPIDPDNGFNGEAIDATDLFTNSGAAKYYDNGVLLIGGGAYHNYPANSYWQNVMDGIQVVDLGGEVGPCFAFVSEGGADADADLSQATGRTIELKAAPDEYTWGNFNFFVDPKLPPAAEGVNMRVSFVFNVWSEADTDALAVNNVHFKTNQNGVKWQGQGVSTTECQTEDTYNETFVYDPSKWVKYSFVSLFPDAEHQRYVPMRLVLNFPGSGTKTVLFIREITMELTPDAMTENNAETREVLALNMGQAGVEAVEALAPATVRVDGGVAKFAEAATVFNMTGARVGEGTEVRLAPGMYVARVGARAVKFVVR